MLCMTLFHVLVLTVVITAKLSLCLNAVYDTVSCSDAYSWSVMTAKLCVYVCGGGGVGVCACICMSVCKCI